jgi:hypothetical protein
MVIRWRLAVGMAVVVGAAVVTWQWWSSRRVELYGGVKPFMRKLESLRLQTAAELARSKDLPQDYEPMEQLAQDAQDVFAVFRKDPRCQRRSETASNRPV